VKRTYLGAFCFLGIIGMAPALIGVRVVNIEASFDF
jgi:hypothetical protein